MDAKTGRYCEKHERYAADGVCPYCEAPPETVRTAAETTSVRARYEAALAKSFETHGMHETRSLLPGDHGFVPDELQALGRTDPLVSRFVDEMRGRVRMWGPDCALAIIASSSEEKRKLYKIALDAVMRSPAGPVVIASREQPLTREETRLLDAYRDAVKNGRGEMRWFIPYDARFR